MYVTCSVPSARVKRKVCISLFIILTALRCLFRSNHVSAAELYYDECLREQATQCGCRQNKRTCEALAKVESVERRILLDADSWLAERPKGTYLCKQRLCHVESEQLFSHTVKPWDAWVSAAPAFPRAPERKLGSQQRSFYAVFEPCTVYPQYCDGPFLHSSGFTDVLSTQRISNITNWPLSLLTWDTSAYFQPALPTYLKRKAAAVFISNCDVGNTERLTRIKFLQSRGIEVHSFGRCMRTHAVKREFPACAHLTRPNPSDDAVKLCVFQHYRFAITIENSDAEGYISEKLFHALLAGTVPIYYGAPGNERYFPSQNAVISLSRELKDEDTAEQIMELMRDDTAYEQLLGWRTQVNISNNAHFLGLHAHSLSTLVCDICDIL